MELPPGVGEDAAVQAQPVQESAPEPTPSATHEAESPSVQYVTVRIPIMVSASGHANRRMDVTGMTADQRAFYKKITVALQHEGAVLASGRCVRSDTDAVKWIAENASIA